METAAEKSPSVLAEIRRWGSLVKFSHSVFALPFALGMCAVVSRNYSITAAQLFWIVCACVAARTAAMGFNRLIDREIDGRNPRTRERELPRGVLAVRSVQGLIAASSLLFIFAAWMLGSHCLVLSPLVLLLLFFYSYTKRFTSCSHLFLGLALACAPGGVWYALTATWAWLPVSLMGAVLLWVSGFDILYSCQDAQFDAAAGLHSIPRRFGPEKAFSIARALHAASVLLLFLFGWQAGMGPVYFLGVVLFACFLVRQHRLISPRDLRNIDAAFFTQNGLASALFFLFVLADCQLFNYY